MYNIWVYPIDGSPKDYTASNYKIHNYVLEISVYADTRENEQIKFWSLFNIQSFSVTEISN